MKMKNGLAAVGVRVYHYSIAVRGKALVAGDLGSRQQQMAEQKAAGTSSAGMGTR